MAEKVVVTGGCGFIGSHLAELLVEENLEVSVFDNLSTGYVKNLETVKKNVTLIQGDILDYEALKKALYGAKNVFHMAALSYVGESMVFPEKYNKTNIEGTLNVLKACKENSVEKFFFPSTCIVYGNPETNPTPENSSMNPTSPYGLTKVAGEYYSNFFYREHSLQTTVLRIFNAYGPRMQKRVISNFCQQIFGGKQPIVNGNGEQERDFIYVNDIAEGFVKAMKAGKKSSGKIYNIGTGKGTTLNSIIEKMGNLIGSKIQIKYGPDVLGEIYKLIADTSLAEKELGFKAKTKLDDGLKTTIDWIKGNQKNK